MTDEEREDAEDMEDDESIRYDDVRWRAYVYRRMARMDRKVNRILNILEVGKTGATFIKYMIGIGMGLVTILAFLKGKI